MNNLIAPELVKAGLEPEEQAGDKAIKTKFLSWVRLHGSINLEYIYIPALSKEVLW